MKQTSKAFTDTDFVMKTPEEPEFPTEDSGTQGEFPIEEVEIPRRSSVKKTLHYPIGTLTAGSNESFFVPSNENNRAAIISRIRTFAYRNDFKVITRQVTGGVRVWRKETK